MSDNLLAPLFVDEVAALSLRYGEPVRMKATMPNGHFDPVRKRDRVGEVCMVIRRPSGRLLTARKTFYPSGIFRLLTGGIDHGETIEAALLREVAEETGLDVTVRRFLAAIAYTIPEPASDAPIFFTFAFLLDEIRGVLATHDPDEQVESFGEVEPAQLANLALALEALEDRHASEIRGSWHSWGVFRAVVHRLVGTVLTMDA